MRYNKIVLAGGSGCIGTVLAEDFKPICEEIIILSRHPHPAKDNIKTIVWDAKTTGDWVPQLDGADMLINLTGKSVNCRYTPANKQAIIDSRLSSIAALGKAIALLPTKPKLFINITSATIYRHAEDRPQDEFNGEYGKGFSVEVCKAWETMFFAQAPEVRKVALRMAIVLSLNDGAFPRYLNLTKFGLGGIQGNGNQRISWIHEREISNMINFVFRREDLQGIFNASAPEPLSNKDFTKALRQRLGIPFGFPATKWMLEIGTALAGTETELILKSRWVLPTRLLREGYVFKFATFQESINDILK